MTFVCFYNFFFLIEKNHIVVILDLERLFKITDQDGRTIYNYYYRPTNSVYCPSI